MESGSKYMSLCDILSDDNPVPRKIRKKNWYMTDDKIDEIPKRSIKSRKNLTSKGTRISNHKDLDNVIPISQRIVHESKNYKANSQLPKQAAQRQYSTTSKNKPIDGSMKPMSSASYTSSISSDSSHNTIIADQKNLKVALSTFNMERLASQINSAGRKLIKLAASMENGKIDECEINFNKKRGDLKAKKIHRTYEDKKIPRSNQVTVEKSRMIESTNLCRDVNYDNCCSSQQYSSRRYKPSQARGSKSKKIPRLDDELNHTIRKNDSFNSIHSMDGHSRRQHRNEVHSSLDRSITPSMVLNGFHPENSDTNNIRVTAYDGVMSSLNRKKKTNKNPKMRKMNWKFDDIDFLDEDIF
ncbi:hypothetical protein PV325_004368 [Microctonus aethiopoides]|nr:hypothetical protein PV325_004368 [Microctonus aethiopoides]KAK0096735.1 hypothetical protein PV326_004558 [Microctonus aethiopoides]